MGNWWHAQLKTGHSCLDTWSVWCCHISVLWHIIINSANSKSIQNINKPVLLYLAWSIVNDSSVPTLRSCDGCVWKPTFIVQRICVDVLAFASKHSIFTVCSLLKTIKMSTIFDSAITVNMTTICLLYRSISDLLFDHNNVSFRHLCCGTGTLI